LETGHNKEKFEEVLRKGLKGLSIDIDDKILESFYTYSVELIEWNKKIDLTSITSMEEVAIKHFIDSLLPAKFIKNRAFLMDIGTGGGFPGIPLKIYRTDIKALLLEATEKKVIFLKHIIRTLGLKDITPIHQRAEDRGFRGIMKETLDVVISRAFSNFKDFFDIARLYVKQGGSVIGMLGKDWEPALKEAEPVIKANGFAITVTECFELPEKMGSRAIIVATRR
jgi:16S rRNA (guanine527-N7)-methyltransferase